MALDQWPKGEQILGFENLPHQSAMHELDNATMQVQSAVGVRIPPHQLLEDSKVKWSPWNTQSNPKFLPKSSRRYSNYVKVNLSCIKRASIAYRMSFEAQFTTWVTSGWSANLSPKKNMKG